VTLPLADVRVLALEQYGAGPWSTLQLADLGAEIIKVEDPAAGGDVGRYVPPYQKGEDSLFFETLNRGKKSVSLDLRHPDARGVLEDLVRNVDVVFSNLRGDQPQRLRITFADLRDVNPRIVCCSLSGFGLSGPRAAEPGYDYLMQALAGWMSLTGEPGSPPTKTGLSLVDLSGGYVAAIAVLGGLWHARRNGEGCDCDVSLYETALAELIYVGTWAATEGYMPPKVRNSAHPSIVPFQNFETADGWVVVACPKEKFWQRLCEAIGETDLLEDERFRGFAARAAHKDALLAVLEPLFRSRSTAEWLDLLADAGVPCAPVNDVAAALTDPQARAREVVVEVEHPNLGTVRTVGSPLRVAGAPRPATRGPFRGEHTEEVLRQVCGYSNQHIRALVESGVVEIGARSGVPDAPPLIRQA
jgi:crotonobetainyl-CoA:carnitine CoA-transferase CaiB-like acyl-CoA transferase